MATRQLGGIIIRNRQVTGGSVPGTALMGEPFVNLYNGVLRFSGTTGGDFEESAQGGVFEVGSKLYNSLISNRLSVNSNFIVSGDTGIISTYGGSSSLAGTFLSGTTAGYVIANISDIQGAPTTVQPGTNITTGGTQNSPIINTVDNPSFNDLSVSGTGTFDNGLSANTISAATAIYSAGTNLETIINNLATGSEDITRVQPGTNTTTGGTDNFPVVNIVDSPSFDNLSVSGTGTFDNGLSANTISASTAIYSAGTNLETIITSLAGNGDVTRVQPGTNTTTGGTDNFPVINIVDSPSFDNLSVSGTGTFDNGLSANTISAATAIYSAGTNLETIITNLAGNGDVTRVQPGTNMTTGGTGNFPIVNTVDNPSFNNLAWSGTALGNEFSANTVSGGTIYSGDTNLEDIFLLAPTVAFTPQEVAYAGADGQLKGESTFIYDEGADQLSVGSIVIGNTTTTGDTTATVFGNILLIGESISGFTSELYIEDNRIELNFNPSASTVATSLGSGWSIQDGTGVGGTDVFFDIRGTSTGALNRAFTTNLNDIRIRESGTTSSPNGVRVLAELDVLDGGTY